MGMYSENPARDAFGFTKAVVTNQLARFAPKLYVSLTHESGRGGEGGDPGQTAAYFRGCFEDYRTRLGMDARAFEAFLDGRDVLEYGPGDVLGVALLMYAHGAGFVHCVDCFAREKATEHNIQTYLRLLDGLGPGPRARAESAFIGGDPRLGFDPARVRYSVTRNGLVDESRAYDLILSRSVLEHVNCLDLTLADIAGALRPDGVSIHKVDLKSHNLDRDIPFDFLAWPDTLYDLMHSHKGRPNRWRVDKYRRAVRDAGLRFVLLEDTGRLAPEQVQRLRPHLAARFRDVPDDELGWLGFWMILEQA